ncbi:hypothetical protein T05_13036 [Trichinella murrelli]|uniref:Uncharacterized protein n=1 Tax=Trichinella murrelli TaxID=144512 RepID=A0A0V0TCM0_9BILA|nr:hypothetical protein T05_13036 [Trichinella murrelli]
MRHSSALSRQKPHGISLSPGSLGTRRSVANTASCRWGCFRLEPLLPNLDRDRIGSCQRIHAPYPYHVSLSLSGTRASQCLRDLSLLIAIYKLFGSGKAPGFHNRPTEYLCPSKLIRVFRVWRESSARRLSADHETPRAGEMALCAEAPSQHCLLAEGTSQRGFSKEESGTGVECAA